jgi:prepilin-type N-terminal cleavage/methylation domain-containing protein
VSNKKDNKKGFTIIEVVLVLAIAGLIFMMVFIALPALQRNQRDTQRKNDITRVIGAVNNYTSSNRGNIPTLAAFTGGSFTSSYLTINNDNFLDPLGGPNGETAYTFTSSTAALGSFSTSTQNVIYVAHGYTCNTDGTVSSGGNRKVAFRVVLEGGGVLCQNN